MGIKRQTSKVAEIDDSLQSYKVVLTDKITLSYKIMLSRKVNLCCRVTLCCRGLFSVPPAVV